MRRINAKDLLLEYHGIKEAYSNLSVNEKKMLETVRTYPGLEDNDLAIKSGFTFREAKDSIFSLARKSLIHIVNEDKIYPMF